MLVGGHNPINPKNGGKTTKLNSDAANTDTLTPYELELLELLEQYQVQVEELRNMKHRLEQEAEAFQESHVKLESDFTRALTDIQLGISYICIYIYKP